MKTRGARLRSRAGKTVRVQKRADGKYLLVGKWTDLPDGWEEVGTNSKASIAELGDLIDRLKV